MADIESACYTGVTFEVVLTKKVLVNTFAGGQSFENVHVFVLNLKDTKALKSCMEIPHFNWAYMMSFSTCLQ